jgi:hypothetical protein
MSSDIEELAVEGMRQFTADLRVSPDLAGRTFDGHRRRQRQRHVLRASLALGAAGTVTAVTVITVAHGPATTAKPIAAATVGARLLAAMDSVSGDILYTPDRGQPLNGGQYPAYPQPGQKVQVRVGPAVGSDGKIYKDGAYSFKMPSANPYKNYTANLDQGGLNLSGTAMFVNHFKHVWSECHAGFTLGFTLDAAAIRSEIANGQFTVIGPTELHGKKAIKIKFNVPPNHEAPPHVVAERLWVNASSYVPTQGYTRWSDGEHSLFEYVFLRPTPKRLAELRPTIPAGYTQVSCAAGHGQKPATRGFPPAS